MLSKIHKMNLKKQIKNNTLIERMEKEHKFGKEILMVNTWKDIELY